MNKKAVKLRSTNQELKKFKNLQDAGKFLGIRYDIVGAYIDVKKKLKSKVDGKEWFVYSLNVGECIVCGEEINNMKEDYCSTNCYSLDLIGRTPKTESTILGSDEAIPIARRF